MTAARHQPFEDEPPVWIGRHGLMTLSSISAELPCHDEPPVWIGTQGLLMSSSASSYRISEKCVTDGCHRYAKFRHKDNSAPDLCALHGRLTDDYVAAWGLCIAGDCQLYASFGNADIRVREYCS